MGAITKFEEVNESWANNLSAENYRRYRLYLNRVHTLEGIILDEQIDVLLNYTKELIKTMHDNKASLEFVDVLLNSSEFRGTDSGISWRDKEVDTTEFYKLVFKLDSLGYFKMISLMRARVLLIVVSADMQLIEYPSLVYSTYARFGEWSFPVNDKSVKESVEEYSGSTLIGKDESFKLISKNLTFNGRGLYDRQDHYIQSEVCEKIRGDYIYVERLPRISMVELKRILKWL